MFLGAVLSRPLLEMLHTPDSIIDWCTSYLVILMVGCMGSAYYNILCGILRGLGDSISALLYLLVATVLNIILDIVFVPAYRWVSPVSPMQPSSHRQYPRSSVSETVADDRYL